MLPVVAAIFVLLVPGAPFGRTANLPNPASRDVSGPFAVTAPNVGVSIAALANFTVTWNGFGTTAAPINAANVKISLSTDSGNTFPTILAASTSNDGSESVLIPNLPTTTARIKVEAIGDISFAVSSTDFTITAPTATPTPAPSSTPSPPPVATVSLPTVTIDTSVTNFVQPVVTSTISAADDLIGFQGDFTFDSAIVSFTTPQVQRAGLTATSWNVSSNILNTGPGTIKTLRVSAFSNDFTPLSGSGILYNLNMTRVSSAPGATSPLVWKPDPDNFVFFDLGIHRLPPAQNNGLVTIQAPINISGTMSYCTNPVSGPVSGVTLSLTGTSGSSTLSDGSGDYMFASLPSGGSYTVTPGKSALAPGSTGIDTVDVAAARRHYLQIVLLSGCPLTAADVNGDAVVDTTDILAIQRFYLGQTTGIANVGKYQFSPVNRTYPGVGSNQSAQNYNTLIFGDVASTFVHALEGSSEGVAGNGPGAGEVPAAVTAISLPNVAVDAFVTNFIVQVTTTAMDTKNKLIGFQGDFTFDERVVSFQSEPVQPAGLTAGNWNVSGNVLPGTGPTRTLRVSAVSNDFTPLSGSGTLFELRMTKVSQVAHGTPLLWAAPPNHFIFIDANLKMQEPGHAAPGSVSPTISSVGWSR